MGIMFTVLCTFLLIGTALHRRIRVSGFAFRIGRERGRPLGGAAFGCVGTVTERRHGGVQRVEGRVGTMGKRVARAGVLWCAS